MPANVQQRQTQCSAVLIFQWLLLRTKFSQSNQPEEQFTFLSKSCPKNCRYRRTSRQQPLLEERNLHVSDNLHVRCQINCTHQVGCLFFGRKCYSSVENLGIQEEKLRTLSIRSKTSEILPKKSSGTKIVGNCGISLKVVNEQISVPWILKQNFDFTPLVYLYSKNSDEIHQRTTQPTPQTTRKLL